MTIQTREIALEFMVEMLEYKREIERSRFKEFFRTNQLGIEYEICLSNLDWLALRLKYYRNELKKEKEQI